MYRASGFQTTEKAAIAAMAGPHAVVIVLGNDPRQRFVIGAGAAGEGLQTEFLPGMAGITGIRLGAEITWSFVIGFRLLLCGVGNVEL